MLELRQVLLNAATTGSGVASLGESCDRPSWTIYITGSSGVASGAVTIETAPSASYSGTWQTIESPVTVTASATQTVSFEGAFRHVKARISTTVAGGTVTVVAEAMS